MSGKKPIGRPWGKGESGNPKGRPPTGLAIAELARDEIERRGLVAKLGGIAARKGSQQLRAIELLFAYAYGRPRSEMALEHTGKDGQPLFDAASLRAWIRQTDDDGE